MSRTEDLATLRAPRQPFDILIIGGGATGLGAAVDAASRGHTVCLMEQADFAKGTSSRSTKLVHGGVRYLRQGNISLVMEALRERGRLHQNAPHLVHPLSFVIPLYHWWEGPFYGIGLKVYDRLAGELGLVPSHHLSLEETLRHIPNLERHHLHGGVVYQDGQFDDARLAIHLACTAQEHGALVINYIACVGLLKREGRVAGVQATDRETGETFDIPARQVINATGVFVDQLRRFDEPGAPDLVAPSQGVHLVLPRAFLPGETAIMVPKTADGRVLFAVPWHDRVVVGTTDTPVPAISLEPRALPEELAFIMEHAARYLERDPRPSDVLSVYAGLRPLVKKADASSTAALSRDHTILTSPSALITITGGKWTTYRQMAQDVIDHAETTGALPQRPCQTTDLKLHGWTLMPDPQPHLRVYGADAPRIRQLIAQRPELVQPIHPRLEFLQAEVVWHARQEMARTVEDILARRTRALLLDARAAQEAAPAVASLLAEELHQSPAWAKQSAADFQKLAAGYIFPE